VFPAGVTQRREISGDLGVRRRVSTSEVRGYPCRPRERIVGLRRPPILDQRAAVERSLFRVRALVRLLDTGAREVRKIQQIHARATLLLRRSTQLRPAGG
jgi:hypothetical protein